MENRWSKPLKFTLLAGWMAFSTVAFATEDYSAWSAKIDVVLNTSPSGADLSSPVYDYPLLVRLNRANFPFDKARGKGQDIRFTKLSGTTLNYHIDRWDSLAGLAEIWVLVDTVRAANATQAIRMLWGNPSAPDSSSATAVFRPNLGLVSVWHLGQGGIGPRPNAVPGGNPAIPGSYDGDEVSPGIIGMADSLDGSTNGDYLDLGPGYADFSSGFTFSAWIFPTAVKSWSRFLDIGNGEREDNILIARTDTTSDLTVDCYATGLKSGLRSGNYLGMNQWQYLAVTITPADSTVRAYRNGNLVSTGKLDHPLSGNYRNRNYIGRSNWSQNEFYQGKIDEARIHRAVTTPHRIRLDFESQRNDKSMLSFRASAAACSSRFSVPKDTTVSEGDTLLLAAVADCAESFSWSPAGGLTSMLLDPNVKSLQLFMPRIRQDTLARYTFMAAFPDSSRQGTVTIRIQKTVPDPMFTMPSALTWDGSSAVRIEPSFTNLDAIRKSRYPTLDFAWEMNFNADTTWESGALSLRGPSDGLDAAQITLCVHNGGFPTCRTTTIHLPGTASLRQAPLAPGWESRSGTEHRSVDGRWIPRLRRFGVTLEIPVRPTAP